MHFLHQKMMLSFVRTEKPSLIASPKNQWNQVQIYASVSHMNCEIFQKRSKLKNLRTILCIFFQSETSCNPAGNSCFEERLSKVEGKCLISCKGLYADVVKNMDFKQVDQSDMFKRNLARYIAFKTGFSKEKQIKKKITGIFLYKIK